MPLTQRQKNAISQMPVAQRAAATRNYLYQSQAQSSTSRATANNMRRNRTNINRARTPRVIRPVNTISRNRSTMPQNNRNRSSRAPVSNGTSVERISSNTVRFSRSVYVHAFSAAKADEARFSQDAFMINPHSLEWVRDQAKFFSRYKFSYFKYRFVSSCATNVDGFHWTAVTTSSSINDIKIPKTFMSANSSQQFHAGPVWKTDTQFREFPRNILNERWFSTSDDNKSSSEVIPGWILFGTSGTSIGTGSVGELEIAYSIIFESPTDPQLHANRTEHQVLVMEQINLLKDYHSSPSAHDKAVNIRLIGLEAEESQSEEGNLHRDAFLDLVNDIDRHCNAAGHVSDVKPYFDRLMDLHPKVDEIQVESLTDQIKRIFRELYPQDSESEDDRISLLDV